MHAMTPLEFEPETPEASPSLRPAMWRRLVAQGWRERWPLLLVLLAVAFSLWVLRGERLPAPYYNDAPMHLSMVRWAEAQIDEGRIPLDGWYPYLQLGSSHFHHYQSFAHLVTAYASRLFGAEQTFSWIAYLLLSLWPICIYWSARLFRFERVTAGASALVSPLLVSATSYGYEHSSYIWQGHGLWSQMWGMWILPLALGLSWRAVGGKGRFSWAALATGLTVAVHFLTGYLALLSIAVWVLITPSEFLPRLKRAVLVGLGALLTASWVVVPLISDSKWSNRDIFQQDTFWYDSYGARKVLGWLFTGQIYDYGRLPVISLLVAVGLIVAATRFRSDERARAVMGLWVLSLLLFFGRPTLGPLLKLLPGTSDMQLHRYIAGVHLGGLFLAGIGAFWIGNFAYQQITVRFRLYPVLVGGAVVIAGLALLRPAWSERANYDLAGKGWIEQQRLAERTDGAQLQVLLDQARAEGGGRAYAGLPTNWGQSYKIGLVPVYAELTAHDLDTVGFLLRTITSLSADTEAYFDETNPAHYELFNVRFLVMPSDRKPIVPAQLVGRSGRHTLWKVETTGYLQMIDTAGIVTADRINLGRQVLPFLHSENLKRQVHPTVAFGGSQAETPTLPPGSLPSGPAGRIENELDFPQDGFLGGTVFATRPSVVLLKASFDPRWRVTVDGTKDKPTMIAPSFVGYGLAPGRHSVAFGYEPYPHYPWLFAIGALALLGLHFGQRIRSVSSPGTVSSRDLRPSDQPGDTSSTDEVDVDPLRRPRPFVAGKAGAVVRAVADNRLLVITLLVAGVTVAAILTAVLLGRSVSWNGGCGDDGLQYCKMARGELATRAYSHRVLLPWLVRIVTTSNSQTLPAFLVFDLLALIALASGTGLLTLRVASRLGAESQRARLAALLSGFLVLLAPYGFRWVSFYPALTDTFAAALGLWWFLAATTRRGNVQWLSIPLAFLCILTRESWLVVIGLLLVLQLVVERTRTRLLIVGATASVMSLASWLAFSAQGLPSTTSFPGGSIASYALTLVRFFLGSRAGASNYLWLLLFGWGLLPLLLLRSSKSWVGRLRQTSRSDPLIILVFAAVAIHPPLALISGYEVHRYLFPGMPFLLSLVLAGVAASKALDLELGLVLLGSIAIWRPFDVLNGTRPAYLFFFFPLLAPTGNTFRLLSDLRLAALPILVWAFLVAWKNFRHRLTEHRVPGLSRVSSESITPPSEAAPQSGRTRGDLLSRTPRIGSSRLGQVFAQSNRRLLLITGIVMLVTLLSVLTLSLLGTSVTWNGGCGDDGFQYCKMARGEIATRPWSRRILLPGIVRALPIADSQILHAFLSINLLALLALGMGGFVLTLRVARALGADEVRARIVGFLTSLLIFLLPYGFRWAIFDPARVDIFSSSLGLWWFLAASARRRSFQWASVPLALLSVLSREGWIVVILVVVVAQIVVDRSRERLTVAAMTAGALALGGWVAFTSPGLPNITGDPLIAYMLKWARYFLSPSGTGKYLWLVLFGWGLLPLLLVRRARQWFRRLRANAELRRLIIPVAAAALVYLPLGLVGGYEVHRYLFPGAPFVLALILADVAVLSSLEIELALLLAGSIAIWRPFHILDGTVPDYLRFFFPAYSAGGTGFRLLNDLSLFALPLLAWAAVMFWRNRQVTNA